MAPGLSKQARVETKRTGQSQCKVHPPGLSVSLWPSLPAVGQTWEKYHGEGRGPVRNLTSVHSVRSGRHVRRMYCKCHNRHAGLGVWAKDEAVLDAELLYQLCLAQVEDHLLNNALAVWALSSSRLPSLPFPVTPASPAAAAESPEVRSTSLLRDTVPGEDALSLRPSCRRCCLFRSPSCFLDTCNHCSPATGGTDPLRQAAGCGWAKKCT